MANVGQILKNLDKAVNGKNVRAGLAAREEAANLGMTRVSLSNDTDVLNGNAVPKFQKDNSSVAKWGLTKLDDGNHILTPTHASALDDNSIFGMTMGRYFDGIPENGSFHIAQLPVVKHNPDGTLTTVKKGMIAEGEGPHNFSLPDGYGGEAKGSPKPPPKPQPAPEPEPAKPAPEPEPTPPPQPEGPTPAPEPPPETDSTNRLKAKPWRMNGAKGRVSEPKGPTPEPEGPAPKTINDLESDYHSAAGEYADAKKQYEAVKGTGGTEEARLNSILNARQDELDAAKSAYTGHEGYKAHIYQKAHEGLRAQGLTADEATSKLDNAIAQTKANKAQKAADSMRKTLEENGRPGDTTKPTGKPETKQSGSDKGDTSSADDDDHPWYSFTPGAKKHMSKRLDEENSQLVSELNKVRKDSSLDDKERDKKMNQMLSSHFGSKAYDAFSKEQKAGIMSGQGDHLTNALAAHKEAAMKNGPGFGDYVMGNQGKLTAGAGVAIGFGAIASTMGNGGRRSNSQLYSSPF